MSETAIPDLSETTEFSGYKDLWPAWDYILLRLEDNVYKGSLFIPDTAKDASHSGEVLAVGPGKDGDAMIAKVGDRVMFTKYAGSEFEWDGEKLLLLRQSEIVCFITRRDK